MSPAFLLSVREVGLVILFNTSYTTHRNIWKYLCVCERERERDGERQVNDSFLPGLHDFLERDGRQV